MPKGLVSLNVAALIPVGGDVVVLDYLRGCCDRGQGQKTIRYMRSYSKSSLSDDSSLHSHKFKRLLHYIRNLVFIALLS
jgi:hypothetical protein